MSENNPPIDGILLNDWHIVADRAMLLPARPFCTRLLGVDLEIAGNGASSARVIHAGTGEAVRSEEKYGFVWASLGHPRRDILYIPEAAETDRHLIVGGSIAVKASGLRTVENFLDMGHFPFVHTGWLGEEPHTEVAPYRVELTADDEILATDCKFYQPMASPTAKEGFVVEYVYKVMRPYTVALYKSNVFQKHRLDAIILFVQPCDEENCVAHSLLCYIKDNIEAAAVRNFMQLIFAQDKPILENQLPKRLPLDPRAETPIRADAVSVFYRRWLRDHGVTYGAIPSTA